MQKKFEKATLATHVIQPPSVRQRMKGSRYGTPVLLNFEKD